MLRKFCCALALLPVLAAADSRHTLTLTEGTNFTLTVAPDGRTVVDLQGALWALPAIGTAARQLTDGLGDDRLPRFSPDGRTLVFQTFRRGNFDLWQLDSRGKARPLTTGPADEREPAWFPDGRRLAFTSDRSGNLDVWSLDLASGEQSALTTDPADDYWPAISPDGTRLAFVSDRDGLPGLYVTLLGPGAGPAELVAGGKAGKPAAPAWRPDGAALAFVRTAEQIGFPAIARQELVVLDLGTRELRIISTPAEDVFPFAPTWRPDGSLVYSADGGIRHWQPDGTRHGQAFVVHLDIVRPATRQKRFHAPEGRQPALGIVEPVTAPEGGVVFTALGDLWRRDADGTLRQLTDDSAVERDPAFAPDGSALAFVSDRGGSMQVWIRDLHSGADRPLTHMPRGVRYPVFAPDGRSLVFQQAGPRGNQDFTLHRLDLGSGAVTPLKAPPIWPGRMGFSADGHQLLLAVLTSTSVRFREGRNELRRLDLATGAAQAVRLPQGMTVDSGPVMAPDGRTAALVIDGALWLLPLGQDGAATGEPARRVTGLVDYPSFSSDGAALTYLTTTGLQRIGIARGRPQALPVALDWTPAAGAGAVLIRAGRVFDGSGYLRDVDVLVEGNRIVAVGPQLPAPTDARVIEARDATVMPGLIDNHAHHQAHDGAWVGRAWLAFGVTSVLEPGGLPFESRELHEAWDSGRRPGPRLFFAGPQLDGQQRFFPFASHITSDRRLALELERAAVLDYTLLKTYTRMPNSREARVIREAAHRGLSVSSHEIYPAFALGGDRVEHLRGTSRLGWSTKQSDSLRMYGDALQIIGRSGATIVPTMVVGGSFLDLLLRHPEIDQLPQYAAFYTDADRRALRSLAGLAGRKRELFDTGLANSRRAVRELAASGARIIAGTDAPIFPYGLSLLAELAAFREAGLAPDAVLRTATTDAAAAIGAGDELGRIAPGWLADLLIVDGDPLADPLALTDLRLVMRNGVLFLPGDLAPGT